MADWTDLNYVVVDVGGNGQQPPDLVELATVPVTGGAIGEPRSWLVRPHMPIKHFATRIHGLTNDHVSDSPAFADIRDEVLHAFDGVALVAHNAHVDMGVLQRELYEEWQRPEVFDTLKLARRLLPHAESYKLSALVDVFKLSEKLPEGLTPHRATYDALVTARLFVRLVMLPDMRPLSLEELRSGPHEGGDDEAAAPFLASSVGCSSASTGRAARESRPSCTTWRSCSWRRVKTYTSLPNHPQDRSAHCAAS